MTLSDVILSFEIHNGLPHAQWAPLSEQLAEAVDSNAVKAAWRSAAETWLTELARAVADDVDVFMSKRVLLLGSPEAEALASFAERTLRHVDRLLDGLGSTERGALQEFAPSAARNSVGVQRREAPPRLRARGSGEQLLQSQ